MPTYSSNILLIDDDSLVLNALARLLRSRRHDVSISRDPMVALTLCERMEFDLLITDQRMPVMNGTEFAGRARAMQPNARIILISGYSDFGSVIDAFNEGIIHQHVTKPWDNSQLVSVIEEQLRIATEGIWVRDGRHFIAST